MITDGRLVLRHRRPLTQPYPNAYSHPLPRFRYDGHTGRLTVEFENDPEFAGDTAWRAKTFHLTALPRPRPRTLLDDATNVLASAIRAPLSLFGNPAANDSIAAGTDDTFNLRQEEVEEQDRGEDAEADDDPARDRAVRVIGLTRQEHLELSDKAWARRQWEVLPLRTTAARYSTLS
jgi:WD repeat-containing protein 23